MNSHALLTSQGWRGTGHSLHPTDDSIGLKKHILVSRKDNTAGLGVSTFSTDQWWLTALGEQLGGLEKTKDGKIRQTVTDGKLNRLDKRNAPPTLYTMFVRGGMLEGTLGEKPALKTTTESDERPKTTVEIKMKSETTISINIENDSQEKHHHKKHSKSKSKSKSAVLDASTSSKNIKIAVEEDSKTKESKEERRARREARRKAREEKRARKLEKKAKKERRAQRRSAAGAGGSIPETKEERRARKLARRKQRELKKASSD